MQFPSRKKEQKKKTDEKATETPITWKYRFSSKSIFCTSIKRETKNPLIEGTKKTVTEKKKKKVAIFSS